MTREVPARDIDVVIGGAVSAAATESRRLGRGTAAAIRRGMRLAVLALVLLAVPATARADDLSWGGPPGMAPYAPAPYAPPVQVTREVSYAHQTLIADGIAGALVIGGALQRDPYGAVVLAALGADVYLLGAPIVHFANRQFMGGLKSLGVRVGLPMLGAVVGNLVGPKDAVACDVGGSCPDPEDSTIGLVVGAGFGALAAIAIDARYFARKRVTTLAPSWAPTVGYSRAGLTVGVGGSF